MPPPSGFAPDRAIRGAPLAHAHRFAQRGVPVALIIATFFQRHVAVGAAFVRPELRALLPRLLDRDRFNARRRDLIGLIEAIRGDLRAQIRDRRAPIRLVARAPVTLMSSTRGHACQSVIGNASFGLVPRTKGTLFGGPGPTTLTGDRVSAAGLVAPAAVPDAGRWRRWSQTATI